MWRLLVGASLLASAACGFTVAGGVAAGDAQGDAPGGDGAPSPDDGGPPMPPRLVGSAVASTANAATLRVPLTVGTEADRVLIVGVQLGANCPTDIAPVVSAVTYNNVPLAAIDRVLGTPCGAMTTRSEQWVLVAPAAGTHDVAITLGGTIKSIHGGALVLAGIDQAAPVRGHATAMGTGKLASVTVTSAVGDLVVDTVGQGRLILAPAAGGTQVYLHNQSSSNTLDNSAASTAPATAGSTTMGWTFAQDLADEWQTVVSSLRPAP